MSFDIGFSSFANLEKAPDDFFSFYKEKLSRLQQYPLDIKQFKIKSLTNRFIKHLVLQYNSYQNNLVNAYYITENKVKNKNTTLIIFPDYTMPIYLYKNLQKLGYRQIIFEFPNHNLVLNETLDTPSDTNSTKEAPISPIPSLFKNSLTDIDNHYMLKAYMHSYRLLETIFNMNNQVKQKIGILAWGIGVPLALFLAGATKYIDALFLQFPKFINITQQLQEKSQSPEIGTIYKTLNQMPSKNKNKIISTLEYLDMLYFHSYIKTPIAFYNTLKQPQPLLNAMFSTFHTIPSQHKEIHLQTESNIITMEDTFQRAHLFFTHYLDKKL